MLGKDHWHLKLKNRIHLIGINSLIINSGLPEEGFQWNGLRKELEAIPVDDTKIILCHEPFEPDQKKTGSYAFIDQPGAKELGEIVNRYNVRGVLCGHTHKPYIKNTDKSFKSGAPALSFSLTGNKEDIGANLIEISGDSIKIETVTLKEMQNFKIK